MMKIISKRRKSTSKNETFSTKETLELSSGKIQDSSEIKSTVGEKTMLQRMKMKLQNSFSDSKSRNQISENSSSGRKPKEFSYALEIDDKGLDQGIKQRKKGLSCKRVLKKLLSLDGNNKENDNLEKKEMRSDVLLKARFAGVNSKDSSWEDMISCSSLSSIFIANENFFTSSPISKRKSFNKTYHRIDKVEKNKNHAGIPSVKMILNYLKNPSEDIADKEMKIKEKNSSGKTMENNSIIPRKLINKTFLSKSQTEIFSRLADEKDIEEFKFDVSWYENRQRHNICRKNSYDRILNSQMINMNSSAYEEEDSRFSFDSLLDYVPVYKEFQTSTQESMLPTLFNFAKYNFPLYKSSPQLTEDLEQEFDLGSKPEYSKSFHNLFYGVGFADHEINSMENQDDNDFADIFVNLADKKSLNVTYDFEDFDQSLTADTGFESDPRSEANKE